ncbi:hypothetical protein BDF22DRAFT_778312 [Syncephalis plumigaleata]|nr:hypothetical protein BDF22DRAFT_778312 [Syncephalis plumigaleata]
MANDGLAAAVLPGTPQIPLMPISLPPRKLYLPREELKLPKSKAWMVKHSMPRLLYLDDSQPVCRNPSKKKYIAGVEDVVNAGAHPCYVTANPDGKLPMDYLENMTAKDKITNAINILNQIIDIRKPFGDYIPIRPIRESMSAQSGQPPAIIREPESVSIGKILFTALAGAPYQGSNNAQSFDVKSMLSDSRKSRLNIFASSNQVTIHVLLPWKLS